MELIENMEVNKKKPFNDILKIKLFVAFLKNKKVYDGFIYNFDSYQGKWFRDDLKGEISFYDYVLSNSFDKLINNAFSWDRTPEGFDFYAILDGQLTDYYRNLIKENIFYKMEDEYVTSFNK